MAEPISGVDHARDALARGSWAEAYEAFHTTDQSVLTPDDLVGLADASW